MSSKLYYTTAFNYWSPFTWISWRWEACS